MLEVVNITNRGQVTIPVYMRTALNIVKGSKVIIKAINDKIIIEPEKDILSLAGKFEGRGFKDKSIDEIIEKENKSIYKVRGDLNK